MATCLTSATVWVDIGAVRDGALRRHGCEQAGQLRLGDPVAGLRIAAIDENAGHLTLEFAD